MTWADVRHHYDMGDPEDEPRPAPPQCAGCGKWVSTRTATLHEEGPSLFSPGDAWWCCPSPACQARVPRARTDAELRAAEAETRAAEDAYYREEYARLEAEERARLEVDPHYYDWPKPNEIADYEREEADLPW